MVGPEPRIRVGVLRRTGAWHAWHAACVRELIACPSVEVAALVTMEAAAPPDRSGLWARYVRWLSRRSAGALAAVPPPPELDAVAQIPLGSGRAESMTPESMQRLLEARLDVLLKLGPVRAPAGISGAAKWGVWVFDHDEQAVRTGAPPVLAPVRMRRPVTVVSLVRLSNSGEPESSLHSGAFKTVFKSYGRTLNAALLDSAGFPASVCRRIAGGAPPTAVPLESSAPDHPPGSIGTLRLLARSIALRVADAARSLVRFEQWGIGLVHGPIQSFLASDVPPRIHWLPTCKRDRFVADPFGIRRNGRTTLLVEEYPQRTAKGVISVMSWADGATPAAPEKVLELPVHLSYPCLIEDGDALYFVPETGEAGEVALYRCDEFPLRWSRAATLIKDFPALDSTVFRHNDRWWLLCARASSRQSDSLHAWHAPALLGPWTPHPLNPLKTDIRSTRPAGTPFTYDGRLYRPAQDGSRQYGGAISINRVERLTPSEFGEAVVRTILPNRAGPYPAGIHTVSTMGDWTVVDGKRWIFVPCLFWRRLASLVRRARGRGLGGPQREPAVSRADVVRAQG